LSNSARQHFVSLGLQRNPFPPTPDAQSYFFTPKLEQGFGEVLQCVRVRQGIMLLTGEVGLGKSTFVRHMLECLSDEGVVCALILNTFLQGPALLAAICRDFGLPATGDPAADLAVLNDFLLQKRREDKICLVVIDDAQNLNLESLELVRLLTSLETGQEKLLQILLVGQPELLTVLAQQEIRQLTSRIVAQVALTRLDREELRRYFAFRIDSAGGSGRIRLDDEALTALHRLCDGNPRRAHQILDRCLYGLIGQKSQEIDRALVEAAAAETRFDPHPSAQNRPPRAKHHFWSRAVVSAPLAALVTVGVFYAFQTARGANKAPVDVAHDATQSAAHSSKGAQVLPKTRSADAALGAQACMHRVLGDVPQNDRRVSVLRLPARFGSGLAAGPHTCFFNDAGEHWVVWNAPFALMELGRKYPTPAARHVQQRLVAMKLFNVADIDGLFGPQTRTALSRFQTLTGLAANGEPDELTLFLLDKITTDTIKPDQAGASRG